MKYLLLAVALCVSFTGYSQIPYYDGPGWNYTGDTIITAFGWSMSNAGDVNGDGYPDLLVSSIAFSSPYLAEFQEGKLYLFYGGPDGLSETPAWTYQADDSLAICGFSTDGGDLNGDGYSDIVAGCIQWTGDIEQQGKVILFYGGPDGPSAEPDWTYPGDQAYELMGSGVAMSGDINQDGYDDLFVSAKMWDGDTTDEGKVYMFWGSPDGLVGPVWSWTSGQQGSITGFPLNYAGDVNGDGYPDILIGVNQYDFYTVDDGMAVCFYGGPSGPADTPDWAVSQGQKKSNFGHWVDGAGDVNGDGYDDVIVSALLWESDSTDNAEGAVFLYEGGPGGLSTTAAWHAESNQAGANLGYCVAGTGDINGDGYDDAIAGAKYWTNGNFEEGGAFVYFGSPGGLEEDYCWRGEGEEDSAYYGRYVGGFADFNQDGYDDFFVSAYRYTQNYYQDGKAFVYYGAPRESQFRYDQDTFCLADPDPVPVVEGFSGGTFSGSAGLVFADPATGAIDIAASGTGEFTVSYSTDSGYCPDLSHTIWILNPSPAFYYPDTLYYLDEANPLPVLYDTTLAATFSANSAGLVFGDVHTGEINLAASSEGNYIVYDTARVGSCTYSDSFYIALRIPCYLVDSIEALSAFHYLADTFCIDGENPTAIIDGLPGGIFYSEDAVLSDTMTGSVDLAATGPGGPFTVIYTYSPYGGCFVSDTDSFGIDAIAGTLFEYPESSYSVDDPDVVPELAPGSQTGTFSASPAGIALDSASGAIDLSASLPGIYTIYNTLSDGICTSVDSFTLTIYGICVAPENLSVTVLSSASAMVDWSSAYGADSYILYVADATDTVQYTDISDTSFLLTELSGGTLYKVYVISDCILNQSPRTPIVSFTTWADNLQETGPGPMVKIYPNPVGSMLTVEAGGEFPLLGIRIYNSVGAEVWKEEKGGSQPAVMRIDMGTYPEGMYTLEMEFSSGILTRRVLKTGH